MSSLPDPSAADSGAPASPVRQPQACDDDLVSCSWCGGEGFDECDDPIQCLDPICNGQWCTCRACNGRGHSQVVW